MPSREELIVEGEKKLSMVSCKSCRVNEATQRDTAQCIPCWIESVGKKGFTFTPTEPGTYMPEVRDIDGQLEVVFVGPNGVVVKADVK